MYYNLLFMFVDSDTVPKPPLEDHNSITQAMMTNLDFCTVNQRKLSPPYTVKHVHLQDFTPVPSESEQNMSLLTGAFPQFDSTTVYGSRVSMICSFQNSHKEIKFQRVYEFFFCKSRHSAQTTSRRSEFNHLGNSDES